MEKTRQSGEKARCEYDVKAFDQGRRSSYPAAAVTATERELPGCRIARPVGIVDRRSALRLQLLTHGEAGKAFDR